MNRFFNKRAMRSTAFTVLLAWLLALASGVANACLLQPPLYPSHVAAAGPSGAADSPMHSGGHARHGIGHGHAADASKVPCRKVCEDAPQSLTKPLSGADQTDPGPPGIVSTLWAAAGPIVLISNWMAEVRPVTPGLPIRLRYPRLLL